MAELRELLATGAAPPVVPLIELPRALIPTQALDEEYNDLHPVVFMHGMGDSGSSPGMQSLCKSAREMYPGMYVVCASVTDGFNSITTPLARQVEEFAQFVKADPKLARGFHAVGLSQGGLVLRG